MLSVVPSAAGLGLLLAAALLSAIGRAQGQALTRLLLSEDRIADLRRVASAPGDSSLAARYYRIVAARASENIARPALEREMDGRRLLAVSREALGRLTDAALVYRVSDDPAYLRNAERELRAVTNFSDWNPPHFLDVAEMSLAVSLAVDWLGDNLAPGLRDSARAALVTKALLPSLDTARDGNWWIDTDNNWNQVCHTGMVAAALVVRDEHPALTDSVLKRAVRKMPVALAVYAPDGTYPEGVGYWAYGTSYSVVGIELLRDGLGDDFGLAAVPGFRESAYYIGAMRAPSGRIYNYGDCSGGARPVGEAAMLWFARELDDLTLVRPEWVLAEADRGARVSALGLTWMPASLFGSTSLPKPDAGDTLYIGRGVNPVASVRQPASPGYYLGAKGGRASINHGQMDAGSFVFEIDGIRWARDLGKQRYGSLEAAGFKLWGRHQDAERWDLLTLNNRGHSTVSLAGRPHRVDSVATIAQDGLSGELRVDMSAVLGDEVDFWHRRLTPTPLGLTTVDSFSLARGETGVYQWMTTADVERLDARRLRLWMQEPGLAPKHLTLQLSSPGQRFEIVSLREPPHPLDKRIEALKRIEVRMEGTGKVQRIEVVAEGTD